MLADAQVKQLVRTLPNYLLYPSNLRGNLIFIELYDVVCSCPASYITSKNYGGFISILIWGMAFIDRPSFLDVYVDLYYGRNHEENELCTEGVL
ncbi:unnamed protein product [Lactuca saligna]|uniref:Uncharacterized protein n=1 Tax=Lactuca saligna TaxID=75948 RepID=A0AA35YQJ4_LACSI|nr:unnamed protein product [Lactuca saligna]